MKDGQMGVECRQIHVFNDTLFHNKVIATSMDRVYVIGGSADMNCSSPTDQTLLLRTNENGVVDQSRVKSMNMARGNFGCALYPTGAQIFVIGGMKNESEVTEQCERYIVDQDVWKRLPSLNVAKANPSICFMNNGSTLYCFGGLKSIGGGLSFEPCNEIEVLRKGSPKWELMSVRLPVHAFDLGLLNVEDSLIMFGGTNNRQSAAAAFQLNETKDTQGHISLEFR